MNHQDVRNQYLQVHGIDPVEIEVEAAFAEPDFGDDLDEPECPATRHGRRHNNCTCEDSRDE